MEPHYFDELEYKVEIAGKHLYIFFIKVRVKFGTFALVKIKY